MNAYDFEDFLKYDYAKMNKDVEELTVHVKKLVEMLEKNPYITPPTHDLELIKCKLDNFIDLHKYFPEYLIGNCHY